MKASRKDFRLYDGLAYWIFRMGRVMHQDLASRLARHDLNDRKLSVLMCIHVSRVNTPSAIAGYMDVDKAVVARTLRELESTGLVRSSRNSKDGRSRKFALTGAGKKQFTHGRQCAREMNENFAKLMPIGRAEEIRKLFKTISMSHGDGDVATPLLEVSFNPYRRGNGSRRVAQSATSKN